jgi:hypothetical protein
MEALIAILVVAAIIGAIVWNKRNAAAAMAGVEFHVPASPTEVSGAINSAFNVGAGAKLRSLVGGIRLRGGGSLFRFESKVGDVGRIELTPNGNGTNVRAVTDELMWGAIRARIPAVVGAGRWRVHSLTRSTGPSESPPTRPK